MCADGFVLCLMTASMMQSTEGRKNEAISELQQKIQVQALNVDISPISQIVPWKLQLSKANIGRRIIISGSPKLDKLWFFVVSESVLCAAVKAVDDMLEVIDEVGIS